MGLASSNAHMKVTHMLTMQLFVQPDYYGYMGVS